MLLGFHQQFRDPILLGTKIHSMREDKTNRWKAGRDIHFATGVRTKACEIFMRDKCRATQKVQMTVTKIQRTPDKAHYFAEIRIDGKDLGQIYCELLAKNDGFQSLSEMFAWFFDLNSLEDNIPQSVTRKLIHWTDFKY